MNTWCFTGRLGRDPKPRNTPNGKRVTNFSVAVNSGYGDNKKTIWIECVAWEKTGELIAKFFVKGDPIEIVSEPLPLDCYTKDDGTQVAQYLVKINSWDFPMKPRDGSAQDAGHSPRRQQEQRQDREKTEQQFDRQRRAQAEVACDAAGYDPEDDVPF